MIKIKICGITTFADAAAGIEAGADMLGFNFYRLSARYIEPAKANEIIQRVKIEELNNASLVGVFVNEAVESIVQIAKDLTLDAIQLHGDETPKICARVKAALPDKTIIKALRVNGGFDPQTALDYELADIMLDAFHEEMRGGTGRIIDWGVARATRAIVPHLFLSGGLSPENVAEAVARVQPFAVDACSSLESLPGRKDASRMKEFVRAARNG